MTLAEQIAQASAKATQALGEALALADADGNPDLILAARCRNEVNHGRLAYLLVNAYRAGKLLVIEDEQEAVRRMAVAMLDWCDPRMLDLTINEAEGLATAALAALRGETT